MLTLYYKPTCPFCRQVLAVIDRLGLEVDRKDVSTDAALLEELIAQGGKRQVPYLVDTTHDVEMYESDAIAAYLQRTYGAPVATSRPRVHISDAACVACEG